MKKAKTKKRDSNVKIGITLADIVAQEIYGAPIVRHDKRRD